MILSNQVRHSLIKLWISLGLVLSTCLPSVGYAADGIYLGETVQQLGFAKVPPPKGFESETEKYTTKAGTEIIAERNREYLYANGIKVYLSNQVGILKSKLTVGRLDYEKVLVPLFWKLPSQLPGTHRIVIDAGHGGKDPGKLNVALNYVEKAATLDTAIRLKLILEKRGYEVVLTRDHDVFIELEDRPDIATKFKADLFVSLHFNGGAAGDTTSSGIETYCLTPATQNSTNAGKAKGDTSVEPGNRFDSFNLVLAWNVQRQVLAATGAEDRGVRRARFAVLRTLNCPGILVEGGFISSSKEGAQIANATYRQKLAEAVANGIGDYAQTLRAK
jgi:N-acetylmuramoyl-L-alanine amidase